VVTVALDVTAGVATAGANTLELIAKEINSAIPELHAYVTGPTTPEITAAVAAASLSGGADSSTVFQAAPSAGGYLRAQDLASVLELFQEAVTRTTNLTATGGSTTTAVVTLLDPGTYEGETVTFDAATTTAALQGLSFVVASNDATTFTFSETLPAAVVNTDTFTVSTTFLDRHISALRGAAGRAGFKPGDSFGEWRTFIDACETTMNRLIASSLGSTTISHASLVVADSPAATTTFVPLSLPMRAGQFDGLGLTVGGSSSVIDFTTEDAVYLKYALSGAPAAAASVAITQSDVLQTRPAALGHLVHVGGHPASARVVHILDQVQMFVEDFVLPA